MKLQDQIKQAYSSQNLKQFYRLIRKATKIQKNKQLIKSITINDEIISDQERIALIVKQYYQKLFQEPDQTVKRIVEKNAISQNKLFQNIFKEGDIEDAIKQINFNKGIGLDGFDGNILSKDQELREVFKKFIVNLLNSGEIPSYLSDGRLVLLSNVQHGNPTVEQTRPIIVKSHLYKILEKTVLNKLLELNQEFLKCGDYQTGFTSKKSTHDNMVRILEVVSADRKKKINKKTLMFIDIRKAYDSVNQKLLCKILESKVQKPEEDVLVKIIQKLILGNKMVFSGQTIEQNSGVIQGAILSPFLFNIYLEDALMQQQALSKMIKDKRLLAFADDLAIIINKKEEVQEVLQAFEQLHQTHNLQINAEKTVIMSEHSDFKNCEIINGIKIVQSTKYLGMELFFEKQAMLQKIKEKVGQQLAQFKSRVYMHESHIKNTLYMSFVRSLIIYFYTPLYTSRIIKKDLIKQIESFAKHQIFHVPNDIKSKVVLNVSTLGNESTMDIIERLSINIQTRMSQKTKCKIDKQNQIQKNKQQTYGPNTRQTRRRIYIRKDIMNTIFAVSAGRTVINYNQQHFCSTHKVAVDWRHMKYCQHLQGMGDPLKFNKLLESTPLKEMDYDTLKRILIFFGWFTNRIESLERDSTFVKVHKHFRVKYIPKNTIANCNNKQSTNSID